MKSKKNYRNATAVVVGIISFFVLFFGVSFIRGSNEISVNDLPPVSTSELLSETVTSVTSETTEVTANETAVTTTETVISETVHADDSEVTEYILNTSTKKFHYPNCRYVASISEENKEEYTGSRADLIDAGYSPCGSCKP